MGHSHRLHCEKGPAEVVLPSPAEEVQPTTGAAETVLLCHHWIRPLHINNCLVQLSYQIWPQKTTEGSPDCWANRCTTLPTLQELYLSRVSKRAGKITLDPSHPAHSLFELLPSGRRYRALSTRTTRHRNSFLPPSNPSHEHLTLTWNTQHYFTTILQLFIHHTYIYNIFYFIFFHFKFARQTCTHMIVCIA